MQIAAVAVIVGGFAIILVEVKSFRIHAHSIFGIVAIALSLIQLPVALFCRPKKGAARRPLWSILHGFNAILIFVCAMIAIPLGLKKAGYGSLW